MTSHKQTVSLIILFVLFTSISAGCVRFSRGQDFQLENVKLIKIGVTTRDQVLELLGPPMNQYPIQHTGQEVWSYFHTKTRTAVFIPKSDSQSKALTVTLKNDIVENCTISLGESRTRWASVSGNPHQRKMSCDQFEF